MLIGRLRRGGGGICWHGFGTVLWGWGAGIWYLWVGARGDQAIGLLWRLLNPLRGWVALAFFSHKVLRWLCPFLLLGTLGCALALEQQGFYRVALAVQLVLFVVMPLLARLPGRGVG